MNGNDKKVTLAEQHAAWMRETFFLVEATSFERQVLWERNSIQALDGKVELLTASEHRHRVAWEQLNPGYHATVGQVDGRPVCVCVFFNRVGGRIVAFHETTSEVVDHAQVEAWLRKEFPSSRRDSGMWCDAGNFHLCLHAIEKEA